MGGDVACSLKLPLGLQRWLRITCSEVIAFFLEASNVLGGSVYRVFRFY
jgi:hypothetical protein